MSLLFADTHNVIAILEKSDATKGFEQIIDFLSGSYIHYALKVNPHIYISCIKQFWNTASVKRSGVVCLPNEEIFAGLAQMGYEKPSTKLTCYKAFFSSQWKFLIHTILQSLSTKRTSRNEFSTSMASAVICLSKGLGKVSQGLRHLFLEGMLVVRQPAEEEVAEAHIQVDVAVEEHVPADVAHDAIPSPPPHVIPSPSQEPSSPPQQQQSSPQAPPQDAEFLTQLQQVLNVCSALSKRVENLENDNAAQKLVIVKLKARVKKLKKANKSKSSKLRCLRKVGASRSVESSDDMEDVFNQGRMIADMDMNEGIELVKDAEEVVEVVTTAKLITEVVIAASSQVSVASTTIPAASATIPAAKPTIPIAALTVVAAYTRRRKGVIIRDPEEELPLKTPSETPKVNDKGKGILVETLKIMKKKDQIELDAEYEKNNPQYIKSYQGMKKRPQTESEARKNMMIYLKNTAGHKMDFFKGMTYAQICPIFQARLDENIRFLFKSREEIEAEDQEIIKSINETPAQKAAKRRKLSEKVQEAEDLRKRLEVVKDEDDDVFVDATPLASKVPVVDYQIVLIGNKPRFSTSKPTNFSDEYLLLTLKTMFEEPDGQDAIWRNQKSVHGLALVKRWKLLTSCGVQVITLSTIQLFLLVERRYPLSRFTLEQLVNVTRLQVEEESEMSLELIRFTRLQL
nr:hypothetical protein [Tanacetum cinerariifolium]